jgi:radical SAM superfamily enzyme YgiQ (UPF0313 family)
MVARASFPQVLLLSCYELGHQAFSLASALGFLERDGVDAAALDLSVENLTEHAAAVGSARVVAISAPMHTALRLGTDAARQVRAFNAGAHVCFFGYYAGLNAEHLLSAGYADSAIAGEFEPALLALVLAVMRGEFDPAAPPPGVRTGEHISASVLQRVAFAPPRREGLPTLENYARLRSNSGLRLAGYTESSRGGKYVCRHCPVTPVYQGRFFVVPHDIVLGDIRAQVQAGARHITFGDPDFLNGPGHAQRVVRAIHAEFPELTFDFTARIPHLLRHSGLLPEMAAAGCAFVVSAIESLSDKVLAALEKGHTRADILHALDLVQKAGMPLRPSLLPFTPWTTLDDYLELLAFVREKDLVDNIDPVQYSLRLLIPPGSALLQQHAPAPWLRELDEPSFSYRWTHADVRMEALHNQVSARVEKAEMQGEPARSTFAAVEELAFAFGGLAPPMPRNVPQRRPIPAGLTESWFC